MPDSVVAVTVSKEHIVKVAVVVEAVADIVVTIDLSGSMVAAVPGTEVPADVVLVVVKVDSVAVVVGDDFMAVFDVSRSSESHGFEIAAEVDTAGVDGELEPPAGAEPRSPSRV